MLILKSFTSDDRSIVPPVRAKIPTSAVRSSLHFHCASEFFTQILAYMLDSLVRVSRRVDDNHFVRIVDGTSSHRSPVHTTSPQNIALNQLGHTEAQDQAASGALFTSSVQADVESHETITESEVTYLSHYLSPTAYELILTHTASLKPPTSHSTPTQSLNHCSRTTSGANDNDDTAYSTG